MKIGIIFCCYGMSNYLRDCLTPWIKLKEKYNIVISAAHGQFKEYHENGVPDNDNSTQAQLEIFREKGYLDFLYLQNDYLLLYGSTEGWIYQTDPEIRNIALKPLLDKGCDYIWLLDGDEFYTEEQINKVLEYIGREDNKFYTWYSIPFKNYIFSGKEYIKGFCPPRIFKNHSGDLKIENFYYENDIHYRIKEGGLIDYKTLSSKRIPEGLLNGGIKHITWTHENGELKEQYQRKHYNGLCSYKFNKETRKLEFDLDYYSRYNIQIPEIFYED